MALRQLTPSDIGKRVTYTSVGQDKTEHGVITSYNAQYVFVHYDGTTQSIATKPETLMFETPEPVTVENPINQTILAVAQSAATGNFSLEKLRMSIMLLKEHRSESEMLGLLFRTYGDYISDERMKKVTELTQKIEEIRRREMDYGDETV